VEVFDRFSAWLILNERLS